MCVKFDKQQRKWAYFDRKKWLGVDLIE